MKSLPALLFAVFVVLPFPGAVAADDIRDLPSRAYLEQIQRHSTVQPRTPKLHPAMTFQSPFSPTAPSLFAERLRLEIDFPTAAKP